MNSQYRLSLSCVVLVSTFLFLQFRADSLAIPLDKPLDAFPGSIGAWEIQQGTVFNTELLDVLKPTDYIARRYANRTGYNLWLYVGYYGSQRQGAQIHSPKNCLPGGGWDPLEMSRISIPVDQSPGAIKMNRYLLQRGKEQQLVLYFFYAQGQVVANELNAKLLAVKNSILYNRTDGALVRITSPVSDSVEATFERQIAFIREIHPLLGEFLPDQATRL